MSRRVIPKGLITNQPASDKGASWYRGVGALNRSVFRHLLINAARGQGQGQGQQDLTTGQPVIANLIESYISLSFQVTQLARNAQTYEYTLDNGATWTETTLSDIDGEFYGNITGLTNGQSYTISLRGVGPLGPGTKSNALSGTPNNLISLQQFTSAGLYALNGPSKGVRVFYMMVGGGGGGGSAYDVGAAGGGAGGMVRLSSFISDGTSVYTVTVGNGGTGGSKPAGANQSAGNPGEATSIVGGSISIQSLGGLGGAPSRGNGLGGSQAVPPSTAATGGNGGGGGAAYGGGGGGGAGGNGGNSTTATGGVGGAGLAVSLGGVSGTYGAGGVGATRNDSFTPGVSASAASGNGGGGASATSNSAVTGYPSGGNGGSGVAWFYY